jgi:hypothetical protein
MYLLLKGKPICLRSSQTEESAVEKQIKSWPSHNRQVKTKAVICLLMKYYNISLLLPPST